MNAVERYLLGEMDDDERAIFEEHFFDCGHCVAAINAGTQLMIAGKAVAREDRDLTVNTAENVVPIRKRWRWVPQAAAASLLLAIGAQIPRVTQTVRVAQVAQHEDAGGLRLGRGVLLALEAVRGEEETEPPAEKAVKVRPGDSIYFVVPTDDLAVSYVATIRDQRGKPHGVVTISRKEAVEPVFLEIGELPAGSYKLVIEGAQKGGKHFEIASPVIEVGERSGSTQHAPAGAPGGNHAN